MPLSKKNPFNRGRLQKMTISPRVQRMLQGTIALMTLRLSMLMGNLEVCNYEIPNHSILANDNR